MAGSLRPFAKQHRLELRPLLISAAPDVVGPPATFEVRFGGFPGLAMDQTVTPPNDAWLLLINGVPTAITGQAWVAPDILALTTAGTVDGINDSIEWLALHPDLRSTGGSMATPGSRPII